MLEKRSGLVEAFDALPNATLIVDSGGIVCIFNRQAEFMFGYHRSEVLGSAVHMLLPATGGLVAKHIDHIKNYFRHPSVRPMGHAMQLAGRRKNGEEFPVLIDLGPFPILEPLAMD